MRSFAAAFALGCFVALPASAQQLVKERLPTCLACHGENGQSQLEGVPSLGAQQAFYVTVQLLMFREKMRLADPMNDMAKGLTDTDLQGFAEIIFSLDVGAGDLRYQNRAGESLVERVRSQYGARGNFVALA